MKKILVLPGWMTGIKFYEDKDYGFDVCLGELGKSSDLTDYVVGVSLGALVVLRDIDQIKGKIILINPPLPKRNFFVWFGLYLKYLKNEGLFLERQKFTINPVKFILELGRCIKLLDMDFSKALILSGDKITVIRGRKDRFFCDDKAVAFLNSKNIKVVEFNGGHNLSLEMEKTMVGLMI